MAREAEIEGLREEVAQLNAALRVIGRAANAVVHDVIHQPAAMTPAVMHLAGALEEARQFIEGERAAPSGEQ